MKDRQKYRIQAGPGVWFPFESPYQCQVDYVTKVIEALTTSSNALLESPTGTGKTICLLSACIAVLKEERQQKNRSEPPRTLVYCTRTHSQIKQVMDEIKNLLPYEVNAVNLASKVHMCVNGDMNKKFESHTLNHICAKLRMAKKSD